MKDKQIYGKKLARNGRTKVIYKGTFISKQSLPFFDNSVDVVIVVVGITVVTVVVTVVTVVITVVTAVVIVVTAVVVSMDVFAFE